MKIKIFADGADLEGIRAMAANPLISGFTTNPTLMRKAGVEDYESFAKRTLEVVPELPVSFEVFSDDLAEMHAQALKISAWGKNVYVKIPSMNTEAVSTVELVRTLASEGVRVNVTAMTTIKHVEQFLGVVGGGPGAILSVFAGRIADSGRDPVPLMRECVNRIAGVAGVELLWASPREVLNLVQAEEIGCHIITMTNDLISKIPLLGKDLDEFALDTVKMFRRDAVAASFTI